MLPFSIVVTAHNNASVLERTLHSAEAAVARLRAEAGTIDGEIVAVDDGSTDGTWLLLQKHAADDSSYRLVRHDRATSPSTARNVGAAEARGALLFFLDGDDLFLPEHVVICQRMLVASHAGYAKTGVRLADPVHPDWRQRIEASLALNLCVRRAAHEFVGGFPDFHLFQRRGAYFHPDTDIFYKLEDQYYNLLLASVFAGVHSTQETVEYVRYPGNSFDQQYEKFCQPFGAVVNVPLPDVRFRWDLCELIAREQLRRLGEQTPPQFP